MTARTLTIEDARAANVQLVEEGNKGDQAVHDLVVAYQANRRSGTACTKTRGEVSGNNKKIYRQKGTGNARHGTKKAPIFVGGGVVFGPRPRSYSKHVPKKVRKLALQRVLGQRIQDGAIHIVDSFEISDGKTKSFVAAVQGMTDAGNVLIVGKAFDELTYRAGRNVAWVQLETAQSVNIEQLLRADSVILTGESLEVLAERTA